MTNKSQWLIGTVAIEGTQTLRETAEQLSKILELQFTEDRSGKWEEFPAFTATGLGLEFALLGNPAEGLDVRDPSERDENFELLVNPAPVIPAEGNPTVVDISAHFVDLIRGKSSINCWIAKNPS